MPFPTPFILRRYDLTEARSLTTRAASNLSPALILSRSHRDVGVRTGCAIAFERPVPAWTRERATYRGQGAGLRRCKRPRQSSTVSTLYGGAPRRGLGGDAPCGPRRRSDRAGTRARPL